QEAMFETAATFHPSQEPLSWSSCSVQKIAAIGIGSLMALPKQRDSFDTREVRLREVLVPFEIPFRSPRSPLHGSLCSSRLCREKLCMPAVVVWYYQAVEAMAVKWSYINISPPLASTSSNAAGSGSLNRLHSTTRSNSSHISNPPPRRSTYAT